MRISHKTVQEQMDAARRMEATDQALILCKQQQDRIATLEADNARLVGEVGRLKTMVAALTKEAGHVGSLYAEVNSELKQVKEVLAWASENVWSIGQRRPQWVVFTSRRTMFSAPTLYEALHAAWENREKGEE